MREVDPCPPCPDCHHKHRISLCMCGCKNKAWREYPLPFRPTHWTLRRIWFWIYDLFMFDDSRAGFETQAEYDEWSAKQW